MVEDLQRKMSQRLLRPLDIFARVRLRERHSKILASRFPDTLGRGVDNHAVMSITCKCVQMSSQASQIFVSDIRLEAELVLESDGKGQNKVHRRSIVPVRISGYQSELDRGDAYSFLRISSLPFSPSLSPVLIQMIRDRLRDV
jgi:hypothetical protein